VIILAIFALLGGGFGFWLTANIWFALFAAAASAWFLWGCYGWETPGL
jgi:hypothetical protein